MMRYHIYKDKQNTMINQSTNEKIVELTDADIYQKYNLVLSDVNLTIYQGDFYYIIGKVGTGKTSLIKTINAEIPLRKGEGYVAGYYLHRLKKKEIPYLRRKLGIVFQDFQLLTDRTVNANLSFVLHATGWKHKQEIKDRIHHVLEKVGMNRKGYKMPHELSGGEQQRVVIARALLNDPDLILADEPTGNLDPETSSNIMNILFDIKNNGKTVIVATHNYNLLKEFPEAVLKCENGKLAKNDKPSEIDFMQLREDVQ